MLLETRGEMPWARSEKVAALFDHGGLDVG
jgi:hypothetical protein